MPLSIGASGECRRMVLLEIDRVQPRANVIGLRKPQIVHSVRIAAPHLTLQVPTFSLSFFLSPHTSLVKCWLRPGSRTQATMGHFRSSACDIVLMGP